MGGADWGTSPLLTARAVADMLDVSAETVLRWIRRGELSAIKLPGGAVRVREDALELWLEERATPSRGESTTPVSAAQPIGYPASTTPKVEED